MEKSRLAPKTLRRCRSASPLPPRSPLLNQEQQLLINVLVSFAWCQKLMHSRSKSITNLKETTLLRRSWHRVPHSAVGKSIYAHMISRSPDMRTMFGGDNNAADRHMRHFLGLLQCVVDNLNDMEEALHPWLDLLGKGHGGFSIRSKHWDAFGEAIVTTVSEWIAPGRNHKDTVKAWMILSSFLSDRLSAASRVAANCPMTAPRIQLITLMASGPPPALRFEC
ncbi:unnamed protein product [Anisakis simplex]|uniref:GLOBIN domain-containing protein n=1 Tax=Anisakis simplex TaxID=6269 RepID=A0A0M3JXW7_ANISI|nr:unnamed protein product [Anisakis simplex]